MDSETDTMTNFGQKRNIRLLVLISKTRRCRVGEYIVNEFFCSERKRSDERSSDEENKGPQIFLHLDRYQRIGACNASCQPDNNLQLILLCHLQLYSSEHLYIQCLFPFPFPVFFRLFKVFALSFNVLNLNVRVCTECEDSQRFLTVLLV